MKELAKNLFSEALDTAGIIDRKINALKDSIWLIPMYHRVVADEKVEDPLDMGMCVKEKFFQQQIDYISKNFDVLPVSEVLQMIDDHKPLPKRLASLTFDDGYLDNLTRAAPVLKAAGIRADLFIATDYIGSISGFWWDEIISAFTWSQPGSLLEFKYGSGESLVLTVDESRRREQAQRVLDLLWQLPPVKVCERATEICEQLAPEQQIPSPVMTIEQIEQAVTEAFNLGAHTKSHPNLNLLTESEVEAELLGSRDIINQISGADVRGFAMPAGFTPDYLPDMLKRHGFSYAMSTVRGLNREPNVYRLKRIGMSNRPLSRIKRAISAL